MDTTVIILIAAAAVLLVVGAGIVVTMMARENKRNSELREGFGPEYDRTVAQHDKRGEALDELKARRERVEEMEIRTLPATEANRFAEEWRAAQARFVDDPAAAIKDADRLVGDVMRARGYPTDDFDQQWADVSVHHSDVVQNYRSAHGISESNDRGEASTEDLRQAMVYYRSLFDDLLKTEEAAPAGSRR